MAKHILGVIGCPMLEDELIYGIEHDESEKKIFVVNTEPSHSLRKKMDAKGIKYDLVTENDVMTGSVEYAEGFNILIMMNRLGLHAFPEELRKKTEEQVVWLSPFVDSIALYYGLCGNYGWDMTQWAKDKGLRPTEVFRDETGRICDDCVGIAVGGGDRYLELEKEYTGMFYVIPAIAHNWRDFLNDGSVTAAVQHLPKDVADELGIHSDDDYIKWMFKAAGYTNMLKMYTGLCDKETFDREFDLLCQEMELSPIMIGDGWLTLQPAEDLYRRSKENALSS